MGLVIKGRWKGISRRRPTPTKDVDLCRKDDASEPEVEIDALPNSLPGDSDVEPDNDSVVIIVHIATNTESQLDLEYFRNEYQTHHLRSGTRIHV